jgi:hypothetical protein
MASEYLDNVLPSSKGIERAIRNSQNTNDNSFEVLKQELLNIFSRIEHYQLIWLTGLSYAGKTKHAIVHTKQLFYDLTRSFIFRDFAKTVEYIQLCEQSEDTLKNAFRSTKTSTEEEKRMILELKRHFFGGIIHFFSLLIC